MAGMRLVIFGPGGFGREILEIARISAARYAGPDETPEVVFAADVAGEDVLGIAVIGADSLTAEDRLVVALGSSEARREVVERLSHIPAGRLVAPTAVIGPGVTIADGAVICDHCTVTASATIGRHFQCNIYSYVAHDCRIGDFVTFAPRVSCNGNVHVEDGAYIGTGAVIKQGTPDRPTVIGAGAIVGMGAVVTKDVPPERPSSAIRAPLRSPAPLGPARGRVDWRHQGVFRGLDRSGARRSPHLRRHPHPDRVCCLAQANAGKRLALAGRSGLRAGERVARRAARRTDRRLGEERGAPRPVEHHARADRARLARPLRAAPVLSGPGAAAFNLTGSASPGS